MAENDPQPLLKLPRFAHETELLFARRTGLWPEHLLEPAHRDQIERKHRHAPAPGSWWQWTESGPLPAFDPNPPRA